MTDEQRRLLQQAFGTDALTIERLSGGLLGRCYRVSGPSFDYAVRMPPAELQPFRLDCAEEQCVLALVAAERLAPPVVPTPAEFGLVATRFLTEARPWSHTIARQRRSIRRLASRLKRLHVLELDLPPFACTAAAEAYVHGAARRSVLGTEQRRWRETLLRGASRFERKFSPTVPCHNDLVASNVLDDGELRLVDFEYAASSATILDLASFAGMNDLDAARRADLVAAYYGDENPPFDADDLDDTVQLVRLLAYFWALAFAGPPEARAEVEAFADAVATVLR